MPVKNLWYEWRPKAAMAMPSNKRTILSTKAALPDGTIPLEGEIFTSPFPGADASELSRFGRRPYR
jgi:hypothetical protein